MLLRSGKFQQVIEKVHERNVKIAKRDVAIYASTLGKHITDRGFKIKIGTKSRTLNNQDIILCQAYYYLAEKHRLHKQIASQNLMNVKCKAIARSIVKSKSNSSTKKWFLAASLLAKSQRISAELMLKNPKVSNTIRSKQTIGLLLGPNDGSITIDLSKSQHNTYGACESLLLLLRSGNLKKDKYSMVLKVTRDLLGLCLSIVKVYEALEKEESPLMTDLEWERYKRLLLHFGLKNENSREMSFYGALIHPLHKLNDGTESSMESAGVDGNEGVESKTEIEKNAFVNYYLQRTLWKDKMTTSQSLSDPDAVCMDTSSALVLLLCSSLIQTTNLVQEVTNFIQRKHCGNNTSGNSGGKSGGKTDTTDSEDSSDSSDSSDSNVFAKLEARYQLKNFEEVFSSSMQSESLKKRMYTILYINSNNNNNNNNIKNNINTASTIDEHDPLNQAMNWSFSSSNNTLNVNDVQTLMEPIQHTNHLNVYIGDKNAAFNLNQKQKAWKRSTATDLGQMRDILRDQWKRNQQHNKSNTNNRNDKLANEIYGLDDQLRISRQMSGLNGMSGVLTDLWSTLERRTQATSQKKLARLLATGFIDTTNDNKPSKVKSKILNNGVKPAWTKYNALDAAIYTNGRHQKITEGVLARCLQLSELSIMTSSYATNRSTKSMGKAWNTRPNEISLIRCLAWRAHYYESFQGATLANNLSSVTGHVCDMELTNERVIFLERQLMGCLTLQARCAGRNLLDYFLQRDETQQYNTNGNKMTSLNDGVGGNLFLPQSMYMEWIEMDRPDNVRWREAAVEHHRRAKYTTLDYEHVARLTCWTLRQLLKLIFTNISWPSTELKEIMIGQDDTCSLVVPEEIVLKMIQKAKEMASNKRYETSRKYQTLRAKQKLWSKAYKLLAIGMINADHICTSDDFFGNGVENTRKTYVPLLTSQKKDQYYKNLSDKNLSALKWFPLLGDEKMVRVKTPRSRTEEWKKSQILTQQDIKGLLQHLGETRKKTHMNLFEKLIQREATNDSEVKLTKRNNFFFVFKGIASSNLNHEKMLQKHSNRIWLKEKNNVWRTLRLSLATSFFKDKLEHNDIKSTITSSALTIIIRESKLNYRKNSNNKIMDTSYNNYNDTRNQSHSSKTSVQEYSSEVHVVLTPNHTNIFVPPHLLSTSLHCTLKDRDPLQETWCLQCLSRWKEEEETSEKYYTTVKEKQKAKPRG